VKGAYFAEMQGLCQTGVDRRMQTKAKLPLYF